MLQNLLDLYKLTVIEHLVTGHRCEHIYRVQNRSGHRLVLKYADDTEGRNEIRNNLVGYRNMTLLGLEEFMPLLISTELDTEEGHILMEDCGTDWATRLRTGQVDPWSYDNFEGVLARLYDTSLRAGSDANDHIDFQVGTVRTLYRSFMQADFGCPELDEAMGSLRELLPTRLDWFCFSSWDFMPGNLFFGTGLKFVDPTEGVTGVPIIDLACLGGALGDVYNFPGASEWLQRLERFSLEQLGLMLRLSEKEARQIFRLGRLVQTLLSLRVSVRQSSGTAGVLAVRAQDCIRQLIANKVQP